MGNFSISGTFTACPDPDIHPYDLIEVGPFLDGTPIRQGYPSAQLTFPPLQTGEWNELMSRWSAHSTAYTSGSIPRESGYGYKAVSAWFHKPQMTGWDGVRRHGVTMKITRITDI